MTDSMIPINLGYFVAIAIAAIAGFFWTRLYKKFDTLEKAFHESQTIQARHQQWIDERDKRVQDIRDDLNRRITKLEERTETHR